MMEQGMAAEEKQEVKLLVKLRGGREADGG